ncbi:hypothetical protein BGP_2558 [Beggiatoa sp. PS]|nr:hypothetical protein BGP_2558 [Beggiatoa sp. PS]
MTFVLIGALNGVGKVKSGCGGLEVVVQPLAKKINPIVKVQRICEINEFFIRMVNGEWRMMNGE